MHRKLLLARVGTIAIALARYNTRIIFATKFVYFLLAALAFLVIVVAVNLSSAGKLDDASVYGMLLLPGILLVFYPSTFGVQNDAEAHMLEVIFGIPDYRYKVWLFRLLLSMAIVAALLLALSALVALVLVPVPILRMTGHVVLPVLCIGALGFLLSTLVRNAYGAAVILALVGLSFWFFQDPLAASQWNLFLNPFQLPSGANETAYEGTVVANRIILACVSIGAVFWGLLNLQKREAFL